MDVTELRAPVPIERPLVADPRRVLDLQRLEPLIGALAEGLRRRHVLAGVFRVREIRLVAECPEPDLLPNLIEQPARVAQVRRRRRQVERRAQPLRPIVDRQLNATTMRSYAARS